MNTQINVQICISLGGQGEGGSGTFWFFLTTKSMRTLGFFCVCRGGWVVEEGVPTKQFFAKIFFCGGKGWILKMTFRFAFLFRGGMLAF